MVGIVARDLRANFHFATALTNQLAHLFAGNGGQFVNPAFNQISQPGEHLQTRRDIAFAPRRVEQAIGGFQRLAYRSGVVRRPAFQQLIIGGVNALIGRHRFSLVSKKVRREIPPRNQIFLRSTGVSSHVSTSASVLSKARNSTSSFPC